MTDATSDSPYKFLDSYEFNDQLVFVGRERETEILLSDVVLSRLVVLFAKTGTGKTSLINAAVRPALEKRGYATFFVRTGGDPAASTREKLKAHPKISDLESGTLAAQLKAVVEHLEQPIVVFFDQFEEFFIYSAREEPEKARAFISDLAELYRDRESGTHVVLSMREDFYVELDAFRDDIPTIFHNDSNLRLRWFERLQARDAIIRPLEQRQVGIETSLVERLLDDLSKRHGRIEPAQLQIVCDTLWQQQRADGRLTLAGYVKSGLGYEVGTATIAERIVSRRLAEQFEKFETREDFNLVERLLQPGVLSTERGTKYVRDIPGLARELADVLDPIGGQRTLREVLDQLKDSHLIGLYLRDDVLQVELRHDYLVAEPERLAELRRSVRNIWPRRVLKDGRADWDDRRKVFASPTTDLEEVLRRVRDEWEEERDGALHPEHLPLTADDARVLLHLALHRGIYKLPAYEVALAHAVPAWEIVLDCVKGPHVDDAAYAVALLGELGSRQAVDLLAEMLSDERLAPEAQAALKAIVRSSPDPACAAAATSALVAYLKRALDDPELAPLAVEDLGRIEAEQAVLVLERTLAVHQLADGAETALRRLARSPDATVAAQAQATLARHAKPASQPVPSAPRPTPEPWLEQPATKRRVAPSADVDETHFVLLAKSLLEGRVVVFLGEGANLVGRPPGAIWQRGQHLPTRSELANDLRQAALLSPELRDLADVTQAVERWVFDRLWLEDYLHDVFDADYPPTAVHDFVAHLPSIVRRRDRSPWPLVVTTTYDDTLERAFLHQGESFDLIFYLAGGEHYGQFAHRTTDGEVRVLDDRRTSEIFLLERRPVILKLCGTVDRLDPSDRNWESFLITEDDYANFLMFANLSRIGLPDQLVTKLQRSHVLFLGYELRHWSQRLMLLRILREQRRRSEYRSWAVEHSPDELESLLWSQREVRLVMADLNEYVVELQRHVNRYRSEYA